MKKIECNNKDIKKEILYNNIFELRLNSNTPKLTECVTEIAFGKNNNIYVSFLDAKVIGEKYNILNDITEENISKDLNVVIGDRNGNIISNFEFEKCSLEDIAPIILDYNDNQKFLIKKYIVQIKYSKIYKYV